MSKPHKVGSNGHKAPKKERELSDLQKAFSAAWVRLLSQGKKNGTQAARDAGYNGTDNSLARIAHDNLKNSRVQKLISELSEEITALAPITRFRYILGSSEVLAATSFLATATLDMVLDEEGHFDIVKARETGGIHALSRLKIIRTKRVYKNGTVDHIIRHEFALREKNLHLDLLGKHHGLWTGEMEDPDEVIARALGIPKAQLKGMSMEEIGNRFSSVPAEVVESGPGAHDGS